MVRFSLGKSYYVLHEQYRSSEVVVMLKYLCNFNHLCIKTKYVLQVYEWPFMSKFWWNHRVAFPIAILFTSNGLRCLIHLYPQLLPGGLMSYLRYLCLFTYSGVQHILCCVFALFFFRLMYPMLPVSLDCPFLIAPLVFSNVNFNKYLISC